MKREKIRSVKRFFNLKGLSPTKIRNHLDFALRHSSSSFLTVKKWNVNPMKGCMSGQEASQSGSSKIATSGHFVRKVHEIVRADQNQMCVG